jgi:alpha,alpha-trehalase
VSLTAPRPSPLSRTRLDAVLFDLDGVLTDTAGAHAASWKHMFDDFLRRRADAGGKPFVPFDLREDYRRHVDGKPRYEGVAAFLRSREIDLPHGDPSDGVDRDTVCGLGNRKTAMIRAVLEEQGVRPCPGAVALTRRLVEEGFGTAVVSSSQDAAAVLRAAGLGGWFPALVDGGAAGRLGLAGKPAPDTFLEAARRLGVPPARAAVIEDAAAGVEAARAGGFALVIGVARERPEMLLERGAHAVVTGLEELL